MKVFNEPEEFKEDEIRPSKGSNNPTKTVVKLPIPVNDTNDSEELSDEIKDLLGINSFKEKKVAKINPINQPIKIDPSNNSLDAIDKDSIVDLATNKLLVALNSLDPINVERERDRIGIITGLSKVLDTMGDKGKDKGSKAVHLHLHAPNLSEENEYKVIEVEGKAS